MRKVLVALSLITVAGCASMTTPQTPDLFPNEKLNRTPRGQVNADMNHCLSLADEYIKQPNKYGEMAKEGLVGGAVGAGTGALAGVITGNNAGRATGAGAAVGGVLGVLHAASKMNDRSPSYQRFVEHCLQKQGYEVIGWSSKSYPNY
jgi:hypothetical protein